jgi:cyanate permease
MALTPTLASALTIATVQLLYGTFALLAGIVFVTVARDRPPTPPDEDGDTVHALMLDGVRHALGVRPFVAFLAMAFVGMGVFNGVSTWVEEIVRPRGFSSVDAGNLGAMLLLGGVIGAVVLSALSDRARKRVPYLVLALGAAAPALLWLTLAGSLAGLLTAAFLLGFFMTSALPIGMQYSAEITFPTPEGTSNGLIQLAGQASVVFVALMAVLRTPSGSFVPSLLLLAVLLLVGAVVAARLPEPARHIELREALATGGESPQGDTMGPGSVMPRRDVGPVPEPPDR